MQQNLENAYNYYVKLVLGLIGGFQELNGIKFRPTNNFKGTGLKHYGCELFSAIVQQVM